MTPLGQSLPPLIIPTRAALATSLGVRLAKINYWLYKVPSDARYRSFQLARTGGRPPRTIEAPIKPIKDIQRRLLRLLEGQYRPHYGAHGYIAGRSIATNARIHVGQRWLLRVDLTDFFTSINFGRVRGLFLARPFSFPPEVATLVAHICCHKNHLPQGAPTSPLVSNLVCRRLDRQLGELAVTERCFYTRYCDDITFSTNRRTFPASLASSDPQTGGIVAGSALNSTVSANGFAINPTKTRLRSYSQRQVVTGLVTNKFVNVPRAEVRSLRTLLYIWRRHGQSAAASSLARHKTKNRPTGKPPAPFKLVVRGKLQYLAYIKGTQSPVYAALAGRLLQADPGFRRPEKPVVRAGRVCRVYGEGKTDAIHLEAALAFFQKKGLFADLVLVHDDSTEGDRDLLRKCETYATLSHPDPMIFIFDRDDLSLLPKITAPGGPYKNWGNNVFPFALPVPSFRMSSERQCMEMLYPDEVLRRQDSAGRRLYMKAEFDQENGMHPTERTICQNIVARALVREDGVFSLEDGRKVALSKIAFATSIRDHLAPFAEVPFEGFEKIFETIIRIRSEAEQSPR